MKRRLSGKVKAKLAVVQWRINSVESTVEYTEERYMTAINQTNQK